MSVVLVVIGLDVPASAAAGDACDVAVNRTTSFALSAAADETASIRIGCAGDAGSLRALAGSSQDLIFTVDFTGADQTAYVRQVADEIRAAQNSGTSLNDYFVARAEKYKLDLFPASSSPDVQINGSASAVGNSLVLVIPAAEIGTTTNWWQKGISTLAGWGAGMLATAICLGVFTVGAAAAAPLCVALGGFLAGLITDLVNSLFDKRSLGDGAVWAEAVSQGVLSAVLGAAAGSLLKIADVAITPIVTKIQVLIRNLGANIKYYGATLTYMGSLLNGWGPTLSAALRRGVSAQGLNDLLPLAAKSPARAAGYLRILPFGDSITRGLNGATQSLSDNGYRGNLQNLLSQLGAGYQFVGSQQHGTMAQKNHEGHPGWEIDQLAGIERCTVAGYLPNVVLLDIGTNDVNAKNRLESAPARMRTLIESILRDSPGATVLVGSLLGTSWSGEAAANMATFNTGVATVVRDMYLSGRHVNWVDMGTVTTNQLADGLHPDSTGYREMASHWEHAIERALAAGWIGAPKAPAAGDSCAATAAYPTNWQAKGTLFAGPGRAHPNNVKQTRVGLVDLTGDGRADYLQVNANASVTAWRNDGRRSNGGIIWTPMGQIASGEGMAGRNIRFDDLDGDGRAEYIALDLSTGAALAFHNSGPSGGGSSSLLWTPMGQVASGVDVSGLSGIQFADLNGDRRDDYITVKTDGTVSAFLNGGPSSGGSSTLNWTAVGQVFRSAGITGAVIDLTDIDGDGRADVIARHTDNPRAVSAWHNAGFKTGTDGKAVLSTSALGQVASGANTPAGGTLYFADLDGTGGTDYINVDTATSSTVAWLNLGPSAGDSTRGWEPLGNITAPLDGTVHFADITGDGRDDYIEVHGDSSVRAWRSNSATSWTDLGQIASGVSGSGGQIQFADVDGDRRADYLDVHPDHSVTAYRNGGPANGNGGTSTLLWSDLGLIASGAGQSGSRVQFADVDSDGRADYLDVRPDSSVTAYRNGGPANGNGGASTLYWSNLGQIASGTGGPSSEVLLRDINGDRRADYLTIRSNGSASAWLNGGTANGAGGASTLLWQAAGVIATAEGTPPGGQVSFADLLGNGKANYYLNVTPGTGLLTGWLNTAAS